MKLLDIVALLLEKGIISKDVKEGETVETDTTTQPEDVPEEKPEDQTAPRTVRRKIRRRPTDAELEKD